MDVSLNLYYFLFNENWTKIYVFGPVFIYIHVCAIILKKE